MASYNEHTIALCAADASSGTALLSMEFLKDLRRLVNSPEFADVRFRVEGQVVHAHRAVLAQRCHHFRCVCCRCVCVCACVAGVRVLPACVCAFSDEDNQKAEF